MIIVWGWTIVDKKILLLFVVLIILAPVTAVDNDPSTWGSIIAPSWDYISGYWGETSTQKIPGMFGYTLEPWEFEICATKTTADINYNKPPGFSGASTDLANIYAPLTATIEAQKHSYPDNTTLIEVSWYLQPKSSAIKYSVYLQKGATKFYLPNYKNVESDPVQGTVEFYAEYLEINYTDAVMEYESGQTILSVPIVEK
jgi:hypothetical protein